MFLLILAGCASASVSQRSSATVHAILTDIDAPALRVEQTDEAVIVTYAYRDDVVYLGRVLGHGIEAVVAAFVTADAPPDTIRVVFDDDGTIRRAYAVSYADAHAWALGELTLDEFRERIEER